MKWLNQMFHRYLDRKTSFFIKCSRLVSRGGREETARGMNAGGLWCNTAMNHLTKCGEFKTTGMLTVSSSRQSIYTWWKACKWEKNYYFNCWCSMLRCGLQLCYTWYVCPCSCYINMCAYRPTFSFRACLVNVADKTSFIVINGELTLGELLVELIFLHTWV